MQPLKAFSNLSRQLSSRRARKCDSRKITPHTHTQTTYAIYTFGPLPHYENCLHFLSHLSQFPLLYKRKQQSKAPFSLVKQRIVLAFVSVPFRIFYISTPLTCCALPKIQCRNLKCVYYALEGKWRHLSRLSRKLLLRGPHTIFQPSYFNKTRRARRNFRVINLKGKLKWS